MYDLAISGGALDSEKLHDYVMGHDTGVDVLLAPARPDQASAITIELLRDILVIARARYDYVIEDTPPGFTAEVIATIDASSDLVMVGTLDSLSLKNTKLGLETLQLMDYDPAKIQLSWKRTRGRPASTTSSWCRRRAGTSSSSDGEIPPVNRDPDHAARLQSYAAASFHDLQASFSPATRTARSSVPRSRPERAGAAPSQSRPCSASAGSSPWSSTATRHDEARGSDKEPFADLKNSIHMLVISELGPQLTGQTIDPTGLRDRVIADIRRHLSGETGIAREDRERLTSEIADDILGYGPLERLLADDSITEIMVNGPGEIDRAPGCRMRRQCASATTRTCAIIN